MRDVAVIGIGIQKWGELWEKSLRHIFVEAALKSIDDAGVDKIDSLYIGNMSGGLFVEQEHLASLCADYLGYGGIPAARVESACASGALALRMGFIEVASGISDIVMVSGVEKMTDVGGEKATFALSTASDQEYEAFNGITFPGLYALMARAYMEKYKLTRRQLAMVAVKNHENGFLNPNAQFQNKITIEQVIDSVMVADPLTILDCSPITDGAAAAILCPLDLARKLNKKPIIKISGSGHATSNIALHSRKDYTSIESTERAAISAFKMANKSPKDIDLAEVHDCFTIAEIIAAESLGLFEKGKGGIALENGDTHLTGRIPINTSGGLKSKGHPVGATGIGQIYEIVTQLRWEAGKRQIKNARVGLAQNMGGSGGSSLVHILEVI